jgi:hypothetical protein
MSTADETVSEAIDRFLSAIQMRRRSGDGDLTVRQSDIDFLATLVRSDRNAIRRVISEHE